MAIHVKKSTTVEMRGFHEDPLHLIRAEATTCFAAMQKRAIPAKINRATTVPENKKKSTAGSEYTMKLLSDRDPLIFVASKTRESTGKDEITTLC